MDPLYNPFAPQVSRRAPAQQRSVDPISPGARDIVNRTLRAEAAAEKRDPIDDEIKAINKRRTNVRYQHEATKNQLEDFLSKDGADLFEKDTLTGKPIKNPDGSYMPKLGAEVEALRAKTQKKTGLIAGALSPSKQAGDPTDEAIAAQKRLAEIEPVYRLKQEKYDRIQNEAKRLKDFDAQLENQLGELAKAREARYTVTPQDVATAVQSVNATRAMRGQDPVHPADVAGPRVSEGRPRIQPGTRELLDEVYPKDAFTPLVDPATRQLAGQSVLPEAVDLQSDADARRLGLPPSAVRVMQLDQLRQNGVTHIGDQPIDQVVRPEAANEVRLAATISRIKEEIGKVDAAASAENVTPAKRDQLARQREVFSKLLEKKLASPEYQQLGTYMPELAPRQGDDSWDITRGVKVALKQTIPLAQGVVGLLGNTAEKFVGKGGVATAVKQWGLQGYRDGMAKIQPIQKENDDLTTAWDKAKEGDVGALVDWAQYGLGYTLGQIGETVAMGLVGGLAGSAAEPGGGTIAGAAAGVLGKGAVRKAATNLVEKWVSKEAARIVEEAAAKMGVKITAEQLAEETAKEGVRKLATKSLARTVGSTAAIGANAFTQELGSIYPEAVAQAEAEGRELSGSDLARIWATGIAAGGLETLTDKLGVDVALGKVKIPGAKTRVGRAAIGATGGTLVEGGTEVAQTALERVGAGQSLVDEEAVRDYINSGALGALGGVAVGGVSGLLHGTPKDGGETPPTPPTPPNEPTPQTPAPTPPGAPVPTPPPAPTPAPQTPAPGPETPPTSPTPQGEVEEEKSFEVEDTDGKKMIVRAPSLAGAIAKLPKGTTVKSVREVESPKETTPAPQPEAPKQSETPKQPETPQPPPPVPAPAPTPAPAPQNPSTPVPPPATPAPTTPEPKPQTTPQTPTPKPETEKPAVPQPTPTTPAPAPQGNTPPAPAPTKPRVPSKSGLDEDDDNEIKKAFGDMDLITDAAVGTTPARPERAAAPESREVATKRARLETQKQKLSQKLGGTTGARRKAIEFEISRVDAAIQRISQPKVPVATPAAPAPAAASIDAVEGDKINRQWNAFAPESGTLGIPRAEMPQVKAEHRGALTQFLKARDVMSEETEVKPSELKPTQAEYSPAKVQKAREFTGGDRAILVSSDNYVVDGHHQWMAKLTDKPDEYMRVIKLDAPIRDVLEQMKEFPSVEQAGGSTREPRPSPAGSAPNPRSGDEAGATPAPTLPGSATPNGPSVGVQTNVAPPASTSPEPKVSGPDSITPKPGTTPAAPAIDAANPNAKFPQKGIKPEKFQAFAALAQRLFTKISTPESLAEELDRVLEKKARGYSQALWNGFRMMNPDLDASPDWDAIYDKLDGVAPSPTPETPEAPKSPKPEGAPTTERGKMDALADSVRTRLLGAVAGNVGPLTRGELKKLASESNLSEKAVDEAAELGVVLAAREIAATSTNEAETFDKMVKLYEAQPNLTSKTAVSKINQAYSTPAPLAWFTAARSKVTGTQRVAEPTSGNGMLMMDVKPSVNVLTNEIDPVRRANLEAQGFQPSAMDATSPEFDAKLRAFAPNVIRMNPPFGVVKEEGRSREFPLPNPDNPKLTTTNIDQAISLSNLLRMTPDGKAVLIIGSGGGKAVNSAERAKAYMAGIKQSYFYYLYRQYNVVEHFTLAGELYEKQGAGWPVDVIVIDGKGKSALPFPWSEAPAYLDSWNDLRNRISQGPSAKPTGQAGSGSSVPPGGQSGRAGGPGSNSTPGSPHNPSGKDSGGGSTGGPVGPSGNSTPGGGPEGGSGGGTGAGDGETGSGTPGGGVPQGPANPEDRPKRVEPTSGGFQAKYAPESKSPQSSPALTPTNLVTPQARALERLRETRGDIDQFVATELGYKNIAELYKHLDGTQIDAIGLAIDNVLRGGALINTDQTGMGKGRTAAAMIRYAVRRGKVPMFVTDNPGLYRDMMRDLEDIGSPNLRPLMTNNQTTIVHDDADGNVKVKLRTPQKKLHDQDLEKMIETGKLLPGHHMIFTSYAQVASDVREGFTEDGKEQAKRKRQLIARPDGTRMKFLRRFARDGMIVLDEAHGAGGASDVGWRVSQMISGLNDLWQPLGPEARPFGIYYLSATYAKRPENMGIYFETDIKRAVSNPNELTYIMQRGGVPLQQILSSMLAENGQLVRRELDFAGVSFPTVYTTQRKDGTIDQAKMEKEKRLADSFTEPIRDILDLSTDVSKLMRALQAQFNAQGIKTAEGKTLKNQVTAINFGALLHNIVNQYIVAIKADSIADRVIDELKEGKSPVVALYNTMEAVYDKLEAANLPRNFNGLLEAYLLKAAEVTLTAPDGSKRKIQVDFDNLAASFPELENIPEVAHILARRLARQRDAIREVIKETDRSEIPVSPIDHIKHRIQDAGFKVGEISGRGQAVDRNGKIISRPGSEQTKKGHNQILGEFNRDKKVALILTKSGSTGISAHASEKFRNKQRRVMVVGQIQPDISAMIQMFGRVFRKGQVSLPEYVILNTSIPAENRLAAFLSRKLSSLNANTTSSAKGVTTEAGGVDFLNKYGDEVVYKFLKEHPEIVGVMRYNFPDGQLPNFEAEDEQGAIAQFSSGYGTGDFARSVSGEIAILSIDDQNAFYDAIISEYNAKIKHLDEIGENDLVAENMPLEAETVERRVIFQGQGDTVFDGAAYLETVKTKVGKKPLDPDEIEKIAAEPRAKAAKLRNDYPRISQSTFDKQMKELQEKKGHLDNWPEIRQNWIMVNRERVARIMRGLQLVGRPVLVGFNDGGNAVGFVSDFKYDETKPLTPSAHEIVIHLNTERVKISVPMSSLERIVDFQGFDWKENYRNLTSIATKRQIITGNLLAGFSAARRLLGDKAHPKIISYTTNKGEVLQGVLMPSSFTPKGSIVEVTTGEQLVKALKDGEAVSSLGGAEFFWKDDSIEIRVPSSKSGGGRYWQDQRLLALVRGLNMRQAGSQMVGAVDAENAENLVKLFNEELSDKLSYIQGAGAETGPQTEVTPEQKKMDDSVDGKGATEALKILISGGEFNQMPAVKKLAEWAAQFEVTEPVRVLDHWQHPTAGRPGVLGFYQSGGALQNDAMGGHARLNWLAFRGIGLVRGRWNEKQEGAFTAGHVLLHEYIHALTVRFIRAHPGNKTVKLLDELAKYSYELAKKQKDDTHTEYGYSSISRDEPSIEFITELFANREFQQILARQQAPQWAITQRVKSVWEAIVDAVRRILMLPPRTILDESLNTGTQLVEEAQKNKPKTDAFTFGSMIYAMTAPSVPPSPTQAQKAVLSKRLGRIEDNRSLKERASDLVSASRDYIETELKQKLVDRFASIKRLERAVVGDQARVDASASAYKWARLTQNLPAVMEFVLKYGTIDYRAGSMTQRTKPMVYEDGNVREEYAPKGLFEILKPLADAGTLDLWEGYAAAYRANNLMKEGRENNFKDQAEIDELLALGEQYPEFEKVRREYVAFQKTILDVATAAGLVNEAQRAMWERSDYVPFYRIIDGMDQKRGLSGPYKRRGIANQRSGIRRLKGGENAVDILENIYRNIETLLDASFKNIAMQRVADLAATQNDLIQKIPYQAVPFRATVEEAKKLMEAQGIDTSSITDEELQHILTFWRMRAPQGKDVVSVMRNGKAEYFRVKDAPLLRSILAIGPQQQSFWMHLLQAPRRLLTNAVTLDPAFMVANTIRDSFSAWVIADTPIKPGFDSAIGFVKSLRNDPSKLAIMAAGGGSGHYNRITQGEVRKAFAAMTGRQQAAFLSSIVDSPSKIWRMWKALGRASENANRIAIFDSAIKRGASEAEAAFQALDIMDFGLRGDSKLMNFFFDTVPFLNARAQGLYRLGRGIKHNPARVATHGAIVVAGTLALLAANWDDDRYWELPEWDRDIYYHFWVGDQHFRVPKPFEVGQIFSTIPERLFEFAGKTGDEKLLFDRMLTMLAETFKMNPIPQALFPVAERAMNYSFFQQRPIINQGDEFKQPEQQFNAFTSDTLKEVADAMPDSAPAWLRSPKSLEHFVRGYFGSIGMYTLAGSDALVRAATDAPGKPATTPGDWWVMKRFAPSSDLRETKYVSQFYDLHNELTGLVRQIKELQKTGHADQARDVQSANADLLRYAPRAEATYDAMQAFRKQEQQVYADRMLGPEEKRRRIAELTGRRNQVAQAAMASSPRRPEPVFNPFR